MHIKTLHLCKLGMLLSISLIIFCVEAQIPPIVPIPGIKLGLSNIITVYALIKLGKIDALKILSLRIILASIFAGQAVSFIYSLSGALSSYIAMCFFSKFLSEKQIWILSIIAAISHNLGQICAAIFLIKNNAVIYYLPFLMISGIIAGAFTGLSTQFLCNRKDIKKAL